MLRAFSKGVGERVISSLQDVRLKPDMRGGWAGSLGYGYRFYHLWYSRPPWGNWDTSYRINLRRANESDIGSAPWEAYVGFTYLKYGNEGLECLLNGLSVHDAQTTRTEQVEDEDGRIVEEYGVIQVTRGSDTLDEPLASALADTLSRFVGLITLVVDDFENERNEEDA